MLQATFAIMIAIAVTATAAEHPSTLDQDKLALLSLHEASLEAHRQRDAHWFVVNRADDFVLVNRGEVSHPSREETEKVFRSYLGRTRFTEYRDAIPAIARVSADGSLGWVIVQVKATGVETAADSKKTPVQFVSAWIELYEKRAGRWLNVGNVSNFKE